MQFSGINKLYKFKSFSSNLLNDLRNRRIYAPKIERLNDPFESVIYISKVDGRKLRSNTFFKIIVNELDLKNMKDKKQSKKIGDVAKLIYDTKPFNNFDVFEGHKSESDLLEYYKRAVATYGIVSFSMENTSLLLWSHYADSHKGLCLEFERSNKNELGRDDLSFPVRYSSVFNDISLLDTNVEMISEFFKYKGEIWSYEREWRYVSKEGNKSIPFPGNLKSIYFGLKANVNDIKNITDMFRDEVNYYKAIGNENEYSLRFEKLN